MTSSCRPLPAAPRRCRQLYSSSSAAATAAAQTPSLAETAELRIESGSDARKRKQFVKPRLARLQSTVRNLSTNRAVLWSNVFDRSDSQNPVFLCRSRVSENTFFPLSQKVKPGKNSSVCIVFTTPLSIHLFVSELSTIHSFLLVSLARLNYASSMR